MIGSFDLSSFMGGTGTSTLNPTGGGIPTGTASVINTGISTLGSVVTSLFAKKPTTVLQSGGYSTGMQSPPVTTPGQDVVIGPQGTSIASSNTGSQFFEMPILGLPLWIILLILAGVILFWKSIKKLIR